MSARTVLSSDDIDRAVTRIAHEILEANTALQKSGTSNLVILGIPTRGVLLAERWYYAAAQSQATAARWPALAARRDSTRSMRANTSRSIGASGSRVTRKWLR